MKVSGVRCLFYVLVVLAMSGWAQGYIMGIDFGSEWMKVAVVGPKTFDIALNDASARKTPTRVTFHHGDMLLGSDASNLYTRYPGGVYSGMQQLLGRAWSDPVVESLRHQYLFPLVDHNGGFGIPYDENTTFVPEEITGMLLAYAKEIAGKAVGSTIKDAVITVPPFWNQHQRQAMLDAAQIAGIHVLSLMNENSAAALHYGIDKEFSEEPVSVIFYDMGAGSTTASLVSFRNVHDTKKNKTIGQLQVDHTTWDQSLGSREFDHRIANHFVQLVKDKYKVDVSSTADPKAFAKLMREATKTKEILSANLKTPVVIEGLTADIDLRESITREKFEELCSDLIDRAVVPVKQLLEKAEITMENVQQFEIIGGGVRVPKVQQRIAEFLQRTDLDKHMNGDESIVLGATFYAATQSSAFKVKEFRVKDSSFFPVSAHIKTADPTGELDKFTEVFREGSRLGSKKTLTFATLENFTVALSYDEETHQLPPGTRVNIGKYLLSGVPTAENFNITGTPKIHATIRLNPSGMVTMEKGEAEITLISYVPVVKKSVIEEPKQQLEEELKEEPKQPLDEDAEKEPSEKQSEDEQKDDDIVQEVEKVETTEDKEAVQEVDQLDVEFEEKTRIHRVNLKLTTLEHPGMTKEQFQQASATLRQLKQKVELKKEKEREKNTLEAYIYETREKLMDNEEIQKVTTEEQRDNFLQLLNADGDWLYGDGEDAPASEYRTKLKELKEHGDKIELRVTEMTNRPSAIASIHQSLAYCRDLLVNISIARELQEGEYEDALESIENLEKWVQEKVEEQATKALHEEPVLTSAQIFKKWKVVEQEVKVLSRRPKKKLPKVDETSPINDTEKIEVNNEAGEEPTHLDEETQGEQPEVVTEIDPQEEYEPTQYVPQEGDAKEESNGDRKHDEL